jgi:hypothetical protein
VPSFADTLNPTPFALFDVEVDFIADADSMVVYIKRMLGDDVLSVELTRKQIWACFERATLEWGSIIGQHQAKSLLTSYLGTPTGSTNQVNTYPRQSIEFLIRQAEPYAEHANLGGAYFQTLGHVVLESGRQDYNLHTELLDPSGSVVFDLQPSGSRQRLRIMEVFHFAPSTAPGFVTSTAAVNYINNEFDAESFTSPGTLFYVLPVFDDVLRQTAMENMHKVRRSHYNYRIYGNNILRIMPIPTSNTTDRLYIRVALRGSLDANDPNGTAADADSTTTGVNGLSNIPYDVIPYNTIRGVGRQTIRELTLGYAKELLGLIRGKVQGIPIAGETVTLNFDTLISQGREDIEKVKERLHTLLEELTQDKLVEREALKAENMLKQLRLVPMLMGIR